MDPHSEESHLRFWTDARPDGWMDGRNGSLQIVIAPPIEMSEQLILDVRVGQEDLIKGNCWFCPEHAVLLSLIYFYYIDRLVVALGEGSGGWYLLGFPVFRIVLVFVDHGAYCIGAFFLYLLSIASEKYLGEASSRRDGRRFLFSFLSRLYSELLSISNCF